MSLFGVQPAREELALRRWTVTDTALKLGESRGHLNNTLLGYIAPCQRLRSTLPELLGVPIEKLFTPEALAVTYGHGKRGVRPGAVNRTTPYPRPTKEQIRQRHERQRRELQGQP